MTDEKALKTADLRRKTVDELMLMLDERSQELMNLRFQRAVARLEKPARFNALKRERARILTVLRERKERKAK